MLCIPVYKGFFFFFFTYTVYTSVASVESYLFFLFLFRAEKVAPPAYMRPSFIVLVWCENYTFCTEVLMSVSRCRKQMVDKQTGIAKVHCRFVYDWWCC